MPNGGALADIKVVAFIQGIAGPMTGAIMAGYGARVVRVETRTRMELTRQATPFVGNLSLPDRSVQYLHFNTGLMGVTVNLKHPAAMKVMTRVIEWADVVIENFAGCVMADMGYSYDEMRKINPDIIMLGSAIYGQTGPLARVRGYGATLTSLSGLPHLTGFPDQVPQFPGHAITDFIAPRANVLAIIAALDYRRRTGKGQYIDAAQLESALPLLTPVLLDFQVNNREAQRMGNRSACAAPHGVYRCKGEERWCVITVITDDDWHKFCAVLGDPAWTHSPEMATITARLEHQEELDRLVQAWTMEHTPEEVMDLLQKAGVAAGVVQGGQDLENDPQMKHNDAYREIDHPEVGRFSYAGMPARFSKTPYEIKRAPCLGEHNEQFFVQELGLPDAEFLELMQAGVLE